MNGSAKELKRNLLFSLILVLATVILTLGTMEIVLRIVSHDRYHGARTLTSVPDYTKIWAPPINTVNYFRHPDTGARVELLRNNLGLRSNYDISAVTLSSRKNIAFFGASFTENVRLPAEHTFPELFKFLINIGDQNFEVLNFGVGAYGLDQSYLRYRELEDGIRNKLDFVVVVISPGDVLNPARNNIASLDKNEKLVITPRGPRLPSFLNMINELYITYFAVDVYHMLLGPPDNDAKLARKKAKAAKKKQILPDRDRATKLFNVLMTQWQGDVEAKGGKFKIVIIPLDDSSSVSDSFDPKLFVIHLYEKFAQMVPKEELPQLNFQHDPHWNEAGNLIVALALFEALRSDLALPDSKDEVLIAVLKNYYARFSLEWQPPRIGRFHFEK